VINESLPGRNNQFAVESLPALSNRPMGLFGFRRMDWAARKHKSRKLERRFYFAHDHTRLKGSYVNVN
jgi:hypothetical protein